MGSDIWEGDLSIHHIRLNNNFDKIEFKEVIPIGQRIRDIMYVKKHNTILMILENAPAISFLKKFK